MPISYANDISDGRGFMIFVKLLKRWKGSLYKLVWIDLLVFIVVYYVLNLSYRFSAPNFPLYKNKFEAVVRFCEKMKSNIPISFLLGFFVSGVIGRWFQLYLYIPWLNRIAFLVEGMVNGGDKYKCLKIRHSVLRYANLAWILCMRQVSEPIENRFKPSDEDSNELHGVRSTLSNFNRDQKIQSTFRKIITDAEIRAFENIAAKNILKNRSKYILEYWVPLQWATRLLQKAYVHGYISDPRTLNSLIDELDQLRGAMQYLQIYSGIMIPLVYTQVIIIAVFSYFLCQIFAAQFVDPSVKIEGHEVDLYVPIFTIFQFLFFMGWLKVAMCVMNPFGDDDEDFETGEMLDYNLDVTYRSVTSDIAMYPELLDPPTMFYQPQDTASLDMLETFMDDIDGDLEEIEAPNDNGDFTGLEMKPSRFGQFIEIISCGYCCASRPPYTGTPNDKNTSEKKFFSEHSINSKRSNSINNESQQDSLVRQV